MKLRCSTRWALVGTFAVIGFGFQPTAVRADAVNPNSSTATASYRLTTSTGLSAPDDNIDGPQVVAMILPAGSVVPPKLADDTEGSPLTILPDSQGFDANHLVVALKDTTSASGDPEQLFGLVFFGEGLKADGLLHFSLSINSALASNPPVLQSLTPGITITADPITPPNSGSNGGSSDGQGVPEPFSIVLWSALAAGAMGRHRLIRKRAATSESAA